MTPDHSPIIVLLKFDNIIEANIIKSKLDAYGFPCFLSEENLTALTTSILSGGVRLHIFEHDKEAVTQLLQAENMYKTEDDDIISCPNCKARRIVTNSADRFGTGAMLKFILQLSKTHYCLDCQTEFD